MLERGENNKEGARGRREQPDQPIHTIPGKGGGTDSPEPVYGQKSQVPTNPRKEKRPVQGAGESKTAEKGTQYQQRSPKSGLKETKDNCQNAVPR